jgi:hypothetical protein
MLVTGDRSQINFYAPYNDVQGTQINIFPIVLNPRRRPLPTLRSCPSPSRTPMQVTGDRSQVNFYAPYNDVQGMQINIFPIVLNPRRTSVRSLERGSRGSIPVSRRLLFLDLKPNDSLALRLSA